MPIGITRLRNYIDITKQIEKQKPHFQTNISKEVSYCVEEIVKVCNDNNALNTFIKTPDNQYKRLLIKFLRQQNSLSGFQELRKSLKVLCRNNPEAKNTITKLKDLIVTDKKVISFIDRIGNGTKQYITANMHRKTSYYPDKNIHYYKEISTEIVNELSKETMHKHIENFLNYILGTKKAQ